MPLYRPHLIGANLGYTFGRVSWGLPVTDMNGEKKHTPCEHGRILRTKLQDHETNLLSKMSCRNSIVDASQNSTYCQLGDLIVKLRIENEVVLGDNNPVILMSSHQPDRDPHSGTTATIHL